MFGEINYKVFEDVVENKKVEEKEVFNINRQKKVVKKNRDQKKRPPPRRPKTRSPKV